MDKAFMNNKGLMGLLRKAVLKRCEQDGRDNCDNCPKAVWCLTECLEPAYADIMAMLPGTKPEPTIRATCHYIDYQHGYNRAIEDFKQRLEGKGE